jgi:hypothetical protein
LEAERESSCHALTTIANTIPAFGEFSSDPAHSVTIFQPISETSGFFSERRETTDCMRTMRTSLWRRRDHREGKTPIIPGSSVNSAKSLTSSLKTVTFGVGPESAGTKFRSTWAVFSVPKKESTFFTPKIAVRAKSESMNTGASNKLIALPGSSIWWRY